MPRSITIITAVGIVLILVVVVMFPGFYPLRPLESVFISVCNKIIKGELNKVEETNFVGVGGVMIRQDYIECGVDRADDAGEVCYISAEGSYLGDEMNDECYKCQYGDEQIKYKGKLLGKSCKPYRKVWRWKYKSMF